MNWKNSIKNTMQNRKITPSENLWLRLEEELDKKETKTLKIKWLYIAISACAVIFFGVFVFFKNDFSQVKNDEILAKTQKNPTEIFSTQKENSVVKNEPISSKTISSKENKKNTKIIENQQFTKEEKEYDAYVDALASEFSSEDFLKEIALEKMVDSIYKSLEINKLNKNRAILLAQTEKAVENYILVNYPTEKIISEIDRELFKERVQSVVNQLVTNYEKIKFALSK